MDMYYHTSHTLMRCDYFSISIFNLSFVVFNLCGESISEALSSVSMACWMLQIRCLDKSKEIAATYVTYIWKQGVAEASRNICGIQTANRCSLKSAVDLRLFIYIPLYMLCICQYNVHYVGTQHCELRHTMKAVGSQLLYSWPTECHFCQSQWSWKTYCRPQWIWKLFQLFVFGLICQRWNILSPPGQEDRIIFRIIWYWWWSKTAIISYLKPKFKYVTNRLDIFNGANIAKYCCWVPEHGPFQAFRKHCRINCRSALFSNLSLAIVIVFWHERSFRIRCFASDVHLVGLHKKPIIKKCIGKLPSLETPKLYKWVVMFAIRDTNIFCSSIQMPLKFVPKPS